MMLVLDCGRHCAAKALAALVTAVALAFLASASTWEAASGCDLERAEPSSGSRDLLSAYLARRVPLCQAVPRPSHRAQPGFGLCLSTHAYVMQARRWSAGPPAALEGLVCHAAPNEQPRFSHTELELDRQLEDCLQPVRAALVATKASPPSSNMAIARHPNPRRRACAPRVPKL